VVILQIKLFYKTQRELAISLNGIIDAYWNNEMDEDNFIQVIHNLYQNNTNKIFKDKDFTTVLKQQCGKRRLEVIEKIIGNQYSLGVKELNICQKN
jgi:uncharacterized protein (TIGR04540 family)